MGFPHDLTDELDGLFRASPLLSTTGIELVAWLPGSATVRHTPTEQHTNLVGTVNGALLFTLADAAFEVACNSYGRVAVALDTSCHYRAATRPGQALTAAASEVARGTRTGSYRIDVRSADGDLVAWYMALAYRTDDWHLGEDRWPEAWRSSH